MKRFWRFSSALLLIFASGLILLTSPVQGQETDDPRYKPDPEVEKSRTEALKKELADGEKLSVWLDGGREWKKTDPDSNVSIEILRGKSWTFLEALEMEDVPKSHAYVVYDDEQIPILISGLDKNKKYTVHLLWWDFDNTGRSQSLWVKSFNQHRVKQAIVPVRLPDYKESKLPPVVKSILLPSPFIQDGKIRLGIDGSGANAVLNEIWITETPK